MGVLLAGILWCFAPLFLMLGVLCSLSPFRHDNETAPMCYGFAALAVALGFVCFL